MKQTKPTLKKWVKTPLSSPTISRKERVVELSAFQIGMENSEITTSKLALEQLAQLKTSQSFRQKEEHIRLKYQSLWLKASNKNTAFFHRQCRVRLSQNHISEISNAEGVTIARQELLK